MPDHDRRPHGDVRHRHAPRRARPRVDGDPAVHLLVIDDEDQETVRLAVSAALGRDGFRVLAVADAEAALDALGTTAGERPGLAIIDIGLGGADGLTLKP